MIEKVDNVADFSERLKRMQAEFSFQHISQIANEGIIRNMDVKQIRLVNMQALIRREKSAALFAEKVGTAPAYLSQISSPKSKAKIGDDLARRIEAAYDLGHGWMDRQHTEEGHAPTIEDGPDMRGRVPLISWVQAGAFSEAVDLLQPGFAEEMVDTTVRARSHTFALRVSGDSMEPDFPAGTILIVEPELEAHAGDYVIVKNGAEEATFKQLVRDGADWYLKPLNTRYPIKAWDNSIHIVGVVRAAERKFR